MGYPELLFKEGTEKAKVLTAADSYYWGIYGSGISGRLFEKPSFWFYFKEANTYGEPVKTIDQIDIQQELEKQDIIILMATEATLHAFPWGFCRRCMIFILEPNVKKQG